MAPLPSSLGISPQELLILFAQGQSRPGLVRNNENTMKTKTKISGYILRSAAAMLLFLCMVVAFASAINLPNNPAKVPAPQNNTALGLKGHEGAASMAASAIRKDRTLTFADRVAYQRAIEEVYWRHHIWPEANAVPKPPLDKVMSQAEIEKKVEDYFGWYLIKRQPAIYGC